MSLENIESSIIDGITIDAPPVPPNDIPIEQASIRTLPTRDVGTTASLQRVDTDINMELESEQSNTSVIKKKIERVDENTTLTDATLRQWRQKTDIWCRVSF